jgi:hypothetical protein
LKEYRDIIFALIFFLHLGATIALFGFGYHKYKLGESTSSSSASEDSNYGHYFDSSSGSDSSYRYGGSDSDSFSFSSSSSSPPDFFNVKGLKIGVGISTAVGTLFSIAWVFLLRKMAGSIVILSLIFALASYIAIGVFWVLVGVWEISIVFFLFAAINFLFFFFYRHKLEFAKHVLKCVAEIVDFFPATLYVAFISIIPMVTSSPLLSFPPLLFVGLNLLLFLLLIGRMECLLGSHIHLYLFLLC